MAWNEPGGKRNPWGGGNKPDQGPPDLDQVIRNFQRRLAGLFGGAGGGGRGPGAGGPGRGWGIGTIVLVLLAIWAFTGLYTVDAAERAVILRFGRHVATTQPGLRWHLPWPIETKQIINVQSISSIAEHTRMLTSDQNLVEIDMEVQYRRAEPLAYAFNVVEPDQTLKEVAESAIRETVGRSTLNSVLESGRQDIVERTEELIQRTLDAYKTGIEVTSVNLQDVKVPAEVAPAQQDAIKAREDKERKALAAQAYANDLIPRARGQAKSRVQAAQAHRASAIASAEGETQRFLQLLAEYESAPAITRQRLYLETLEHVMKNSRKVILDTEGAGNLVYLPIDKLLEQGRRLPAAEPGDSDMTVEGSPNGDSTAAGDERRTRGTR